MELLSNLNIQLYLAAYLIGSIPFGYLLAKNFAGVDVKQEGSGNIGATNVLRVLKQRDPALAKKLGAATLFLDAIKGVVILLIAKMLGASPSTLWTIAVLAVWGHCFSIFLGFDGGKGVATGFGVLLFLLPIPTLIALAAWAVAAKTLKISSLSSLIALAALMIASYLLYPEGVPGIGTHAPVWIIALTVLYKHIPNLIRLFNKEEAPVA
ncbi:glycerol-3-phosphate 1-O-acyltransferase PlsY [Nitratifractor salsuginis]|uniref:Glycerol-3-phosphate acyltransferase n=1 Tax=Nitratifractor salsuginis (strain DSM 16511 / JCM 12458 / E9I37-1) TaxID=749222 RepID=E6X2E5_NITSE|nr:glycerol-3-phosphate 1-O-acyltransferase PlsY [Nitratifractor salsuginis]ADV47150.1 acyl-phosphate glycerol-3-phosphate acyltransferase [Nitratifractor salsuginis DSM 16511]